MGFLGWAVLVSSVLCVHAIVGNCPVDQSLTQCEVTFMCTSLCIGANQNPTGCAACASTLTCGTNAACSLLLTCEICSLYYDSADAAVCQSLGASGLCPVPCNAVDFQCQITQSCTFLIATAPTSAASTACLALSQANCSSNPQCENTQLCTICSWYSPNQPGFCSVLTCVVSGEGFQPTLASLNSHVLPDWYANAKLGMFVHWGLYSVPAFAEDQGLTFGELIAIDGITYTMQHNPYSEWYWSAINTPGTLAGEFHRTTYNNSAYRDFQQVFTAEAAKRTVADWMDVFLAIKARYIIPITRHHDGFAMWPSQVPHPDPDYATYRATVSGDLITPLAEAVRAAGLKLGMYYSGGEDWSQPSSTFPTSQATFFSAEPSDPSFIAYSNAQWRELIELYSPDILWNDYSIAAGFDKLQLFADYYNVKPDGVINDRWNALSLLLQAHPQGTHFDFATEELSLDAHATKWEFTRGLDHGFAYDRNSLPSSFMTGNDIVDLLVQVVSLNGNLLLNIGPYPNGTIPDSQLVPLRQFASWIAFNSEAIFDTKPFSVPSTTVQQDATVSTWLTTSITDSSLYAIVTNHLPECAMQTNCSCPLTFDGFRLQPNTVITLLGSTGAIPFLGGTACRGVTLFIDADSLRTVSPPLAVNAYAWSFKIVPPPIFDNSSALCATATAMEYTGSSATTCSDSVTLSARLTVVSTATGVQGQQVQFYSISSGGTIRKACSAVTDFRGSAHCTVVFDTADVTQIRVSYAGHNNMLGSCVTQAISVQLKPTHFHNVGSTVLANGLPATFAALLSTKSGVALPHRNVVFSLNSQVCTGVTNTVGYAQCVVSKLVQPDGYGSVSVSVDADSCYAANLTSVSILAFSFPSGGAYVVGDLSARGVVHFRASARNWARYNSLSLSHRSEDGTADFSGFATGPFGVSSSSVPVCGAWYPRYPDQILAGPIVLPEYMGVIVTDRIQQVRLDGNPSRFGEHTHNHGNFITNGNTVKVVVVKPNLIQDPDAGVGVVVATYFACY